RYEKAGPTCGSHPGSGGWGGFGTTSFYFRKPCPYQSQLLLSGVRAAALPLGASFSCIGTAACCFRGIALFLGALLCFLTLRGDQLTVRIVEAQPSGIQTLIQARPIAQPKPDLITPHPAALVGDEFLVTSPLQSPTLKLAELRVVAEVFRRLPNSLVEFLL